jgi:hypothetical protein
MTHRRFLSAVTFCAVAVSLAVGDRPASAQSSPSSSPVLTACAVDINALCPGLEPGRIRQCMKEKREQLSEGCKNAITAARAQRRTQEQSGSAD